MGLEWRCGRSDLTTSCGSQVGAEPSQGGLGGAGHSRESHLNSTSKQTRGTHNTGSYGGLGPGRKSA